MSHIVEQRFSESRISEMCYTVGCWLTLVPEVLVLLSLLGLYQSFNNALFIALLISAVVILFITRIIALYLAQVALVHQRLYEAQTFIQIALAIYPWSADAIALRGILALALNDLVSAEYNFAQAIHLLPTQVNFYIAHSTALLGLKQFEQASAAARRALVINPTHPQVFLCLAEAEPTSERVEEYLRAGLRQAHTAEIKIIFHCEIARYLMKQCRYAEASLSLHHAESLVNQRPAHEYVQLRRLLGEMLLTQSEIEHAN